MDKNGLPEKSFLDSVSYKTQVFDRSLNGIHLSKIQLSDVLFDLIRYQQMIAANTQINQYAPFRVKTHQSVILKYEKYVRAGGNFTTCFNDLLGFRIIVSDYPSKSSLPIYFRVVDLRHGKT